MAQLMVLAAGLGSRLRPLTDELPKPLVPVGDVPMLEHVLRHAERLGLTSAVVNAHWCAPALHAFGGRFQRSLTVLDEPELLGTAGGIRHALPTLDAPVLIWNGDIWAQPQPMQWQAAMARAEPTLFVSYHPSGETHDNAIAASVLEGNVGLDNVGRVVRLRGECFGQEITGAHYIGLMVLPQAACAELPPRGCYVGDFLLPWLRSGRIVHTERVTDAWFDIGTLDDYQQLNRYWLRARPEQSYLGVDCRVDGRVQLERTIVGDGAIITGGGRVTDCVIWPGAHVVAPVASAVITTSGRVVRPTPSSRVS
jgi:mannose-1-phosphate guanylyltransferase